MGQFKNILGMKFNELLVIEFAGMIKQNRAAWLCRCSCGKEKVIASKCLIGGMVKSCGHLLSESSKKKKKDITGKRFGRLVAVEFSGRTSKGCATWLCQCDCGNMAVVKLQHLSSGGTTSCGCYHKELLLARITKHGLSRTSEYRHQFSNNRRELEMKLDSEWTTEMSKHLKAYFPSCVVCHSDKKLTIDHVLPLKSGYGLKPGNAVRLCNHCNCVKSARSLDSLPGNMGNIISIAAKDFETYWGKIKSAN